MMGIHSSMPVILREEDMEVWLFLRLDVDKLLDRHFAD